MRCEDNTLQFVYNVKQTIVSDDRQLRVPAAESAGNTLKPAVRLLFYDPDATYERKLLGKTACSIDNGYNSNRAKYLFKAEDRCCSFSFG